MKSSFAVHRSLWAAIGSSELLAAALLVALLGGCRIQAAALPPTPRFSLQQSNSQWWLVAPGGRPFFSSGVSVVTRGATRESHDIENPAYAAWQHYPHDGAWADETLTRLRNWRFTTIGGWSHHQILLQSSNMLSGLTPVLHIGSTAGAPWWDMWDEKIIQRMDNVAREQILAVRDDPRLIGYYSDNEMGWWNAALFRMTLEQASSSGQRQRLIQLLRETYDGDWGKLTADFDPELADSFQSLEQRGQLWLRPGSRGIVVMRRFLSQMASRYYQLVHGIIRKYDSRALILGDRYQSFYYPEVARAAAPWVDAISSNLNASWHDGTFARFHLDTLHALTGRPVLVSEYYMAATENRTGNRNNHGVFPLVLTQRERAAGLERTLRSLTRLPYVVGADWFQFFDEPRHGREDGENYNFGLVDVWNRPYEEVTRAFARIDLNALKREAVHRRPDVTAGVPSATRDPFGNLTAGQALRHWDRERGFVPAASEFPVADLYVCWSAQAIYLGLFGYDFVEDGYYRDKAIPKKDRALWTVTPVTENTDAVVEPVRARVGSGREGIPSDPTIRLLNVCGINLSVRNVAVMELPAERFGRRRFRAGDEVEFRSTLTTHAEAYRVEWKGRFRLAK
ncbi:MAG: hypothetical protein FJ405_08535 [Verrucomicrobia bacterium]|nr:hypothetical protein [Verrucomicrobiota bacterium]